MSTQEAPARGAHIANPAPLGLAGFALTTFVLSCFNAGWLDGGGEGIVLGLALGYGGLAQLLAGMWEFTKGNVFGATAFSSYGAFWISFWWFVEHDAAGLPAGSGAVAVYLLAWGIFTAYMTIGALKVSTPVAVVFVLLTITFLLLSWADFGSGSTTIKHIGGYFGLATALAAWYASLAGVTAFTHGKSVVPS